MQRPSNSKTASSGRFSLVRVGVVLLGVGVVSGGLSTYFLASPPSPTALDLFSGFSIQAGLLCLFVALAIQIIRARAARAERLIGAHARIFGLVLITLGLAGFAYEKLEDGFVQLGITWAVLVLGGLAWAAYGQTSYRMTSKNVKEFRRGLSNAPLQQPGGAGVRAGGTVE